MSPFPRILFRTGSAAVMVSGFLRLGDLPLNLVIENQYGGHLQYLTIQGLAIAVCTMAIGALIDVVPSLRPSLSGLRRGLFVAAMPLAVIISSIYWTLLIFFPRLIIADNAMDPSPPTSSESEPVPFRLPLSIDLPLHAVPACALLFDFLVFESKYSRWEVDVFAPIVASLYGIFYGMWVEHCAGKNNNIFPYPFLTENPFKIRVMIYGGAAILAAASFKFLNSIHPR